jgi:hypothetical protein
MVKPGRKGISTLNLKQARRERFLFDANITPILGYSKIDRVFSKSAAGAKSAFNDRVRLIREGSELPPENDNLGSQDILYNINRHSAKQR